MTRRRPTLAALAPALLLAACAPSPRAAAETHPRPPHVHAHAAAEGDAAFLRGMIHHHAQALEMTALVPERTSTPALRLLAERIQVSQRDEIALMSRLLTDRGGAPPAAHEGHGGMPGMLTAEEMASLAAVRGDAFDRRFLALMIRHHEGALAMVEALFATPGAGQDTAVFQLANDVAADQQAEIDRMRRLLADLGG